jgi:hypothetical protein
MIYLVIGALVLMILAAWWDVCRTSDKINSALDRLSDAIDKITDGLPK